MSHFSFASRKQDEVPVNPNFCSATNWGTRVISANDVCETKTASTPNILENRVSTIPMDSFCNSHFPERKSSLSTSQFCNSCWKKQSSHVLLNVVYMNLFRVTRQSSSHEPGGSTKISPAGPQRSFSEHSWQNVLLSFYDGRRRGRPSRSALVLPWLHRPKLPKWRGCPLNKYIDRPTLQLILLQFILGICLCHF